MRYKCLDCGHEWVGSSYTTQCPECGSTNIVQMRSNNIFEKIKNWIKENNLISGFIFGILILILIGPCINSDNGTDDIPTPQMYTLEFNTKNIEYCIVKLKTSDGKIVDYSQLKYSFLNLDATVNDKNGDSYTLDIKQNKIYYCMQGEVTITYNTKSNNGLSSLDPKFTGTKRIQDVNPNNINKKCTPNIELGEPYYNDCQIIVPVIEGKSNAFISINGENGKFKNNTSFSNNDIKESNFEIWYYPKGHENKKKKHEFKNKKEILKEIENSNNDVISNNEIKRIKDKIINALKALNNQDYDKGHDDLMKIAANNCDITGKYKGTKIDIESFAADIELYHDDDKSTNDLLRPTITFEPKDDCGECGKFILNFTKN